MSLAGCRKRGRGAGGALIAALALIAGCGGPPAVRVFEADRYPEWLSEWGLVTRDGNRLILGKDVTPYEVASPLFSDYALKLRTWYVPPDSRITYRAEGPFEFPPGSVITKTFFYPVHDGVAQAAPSWDGDVAGLDLDRHRLVETRLLVRRAGGWDALPYVWEGDDARLRITGALVRLELSVDGAPTDLPYLVPARSECASCHATDHGARTLELIGLKAWQLDRPYYGHEGEPSQLAAWAAADRLAGLPDVSARPAAVAWSDTTRPVAERARAYLDANCGHCHSATGAADTSGLHLDRDAASFRDLGVCKPPIAAGRGTGGRPYSIVPGEPDRSILIYRMETDDPATRMPEIGRAVTHREGVALLTEWIADLPGRCL
ncbi:MAG TPA: SO2930 family diheme c-type cytochrome [Pseudomonadales bacterium]